jgi:protein-S-isoprenylcysteine O-methyltransferase Ste14
MIYTSIGVALIMLGVSFMIVGFRYMYIGIKLKKEENRFKKKFYKKY